MDIVPVLHVQDGQPVVGQPGAWRPLPKPYPDGGDDLRGFLRHLFVRFGDVLVVDLGTGPNREPDHTLLQRLAKQHVELWVDAFPETMEDIMDLFVSGASRLTVRMDTVDPDDLLEVLEIAEGEIHLGYAYASEAELVQLLRDVPPTGFLAAGAAGIVLIDLGRAGRAAGADVTALRHVAGLDVPVRYAGGVRDGSDVDRLEEAGATGVFVGQALLSDLPGWMRIAIERKDEDEEPPQEETPTLEAREGRSFLPGVLPSRPRIPVVDDERARE